MQFSYIADSSYTGRLNSLYKQKIFITHNFIPDSVCKEVIDTCKSKETLHSYGSNLNEPTEFAQIYTSQFSLDLISTYINDSVQLAMARYGRSFMVMEEPSIRLLPPLLKPQSGRGYLQLHSDGEVQNENNVESSGLHEISVLFYFNDDFVGGEIEFPDYDLVVTPATGMMLMFPSGHQYKHRVREVVSGQRIYCPIFLTQPKMAMFREYSTE